LSPTTLKRCHNALLAHPGCTYLDQPARSRLIDAHVARDSGADDQLPSLAPVPSDSLYRVGGRETRWQSRRRRHHEHNARQSALVTPIQADNVLTNRCEDNCGPLNCHDSHGRVGVPRWYRGSWVCCVGARRAGAE
jgi:hypothetical protein